MPSLRLFPASNFRQKVWVHFIFWRHNWTILDWIEDVDIEAGFRDQSAGVIAFLAPLGQIAFGARKRQFGFHEVRSEAAAKTFGQIAMLLRHIDTSCLDRSHICALKKPARMLGTSVCLASGECFPVYIHAHADNEFLWRCGRHALPTALRRTEADAPVWL
ncbi:MAG: hypothetical protein WDN48_05865 [Pseudolabrys sp.]